MQAEGIGTDAADIQLQLVRLHEREREWAQKETERIMKLEGELEGMKAHRDSLEWSMHQLQASSLACTPKQERNNRHHDLRFHSKHVQTCTLPGSVMYGFNVLQKGREHDLYLC